MWPVPEFDARFVAAFFAKLAGAALFMYPCMVLLFNTTPVAIRFDEWPARALIVFSAGIFVAIVGLPRRPGPWRPSRTTVLVWAAVFTFVLPFALLKIVMGDNRVEPILIFLAGDNLAEVIAVGRGSYAGLLLKAALFFTVFVLTLLFFVRRYRHMERVVHVLCAALVVLHPATDHVFRSLYPDELKLAFDVDANFVPPADLAAPASPRNLIIVYLESLEATFERLPVTAAAFAPLAKLRERAFSAANISQVEGTTYTIAGIVATQCGVPLIPYGLNDIGFDHHTEHSLDTMMSPVICLGDVLARDGYVTSYMNGASLERYSKRGFLTTHGYDRLFGLESVDPAAVVGRENVFGMNDGMLFEHVTGELEALQRLGKPFLLSVLTVGTHGPYGFHDRDCPSRGDRKGLLAAAIRCTGEMLGRLLDTLERLGLAESTLVAVMSDHLVINRHLILTPVMAGALARERERRRNLFFIHGIPPGRTVKPAAMIDVYPTLLEALGYRPERRRANLGVSLFSEEPTLVETYGVTGVDRLFLHNTKLARVLWKK